MSKKTLEELVFHDDFMFAAVMMDAENCRCFLERVLEIQIERVEISTEHGFFFNPECKSIRMDVFVTLIPWGRKNAVIPSADTVKKREMYLVTESALFFLIQMEKIVRKYQRNW